MGKMGGTPILSVKVSFEKIKGATHKNSEPGGTCARSLCVKKSQRLFTRVFAFAFFQCERAFYRLLFYISKAQPSSTNVREHMFLDAWEEFTRNVFLSRVVITTIVIKIMESMGLSPILSIIHTVTIGTMLNFNGGNNIHGQKMFRANRPSRYSTSSTAPNQHPCISVGQCVMYLL